MKKGKKPQDSEREDALVTKFALISKNFNRIGIDASDEFDGDYELKTTTKSSVSTARDVGLDHLTKWRRRNWICAKGYYEEDTFIFEEIYFLWPDDLELWFSKIENKLTAKTDLFQRILSLLKEHKFAWDEIEQLHYVFKRGILLNDPNIPWTYIKTHGTKIEGEPIQALRTILATKPAQRPKQLNLFD